MNDLFDEDTEEKKKSSEFARLLEDSFRKTKKSLSVGEKIRSEILSIGKDEVFVSTGTMHDGLVPKKDLLDKDGKLNCKMGDFLDLYVTQARDSEIFLSPNPTSKNIADNLEDAFDMMLPVEGRVTEVCKGGFRISLMGKTAFCPVSQMDIKRVEAPDDYIGQRFEFMITHFSEGGRNVVVSRRKYLEEKKGLSENAFVEDHKLGEILQGTITRIEKFGAFVEIAPGIEGLVHISELSWSRIIDPHDVVSLGKAVTVKLLKTEELEGRLKISLSIKQAMLEPWKNIPAEIKIGQVVTGKVARCMKFGAFVELVPGIEGLIPLGEMSNTKRILRSDEVVKEGEQILVVIKDIQVSEHRILLSLKDVGEDPNREDWTSFSKETSGSFGTLGDQLQQALKKKKA